MSNSSSSSFIVAFDSVPQNAEDVRKQMFMDDETFETEGWDSEKFIPVYHPTIDIAKDVFGQIEGQELNTKKELLEVLSSGTVGGEPEYDFDLSYDREKKEFNREYGKEYDKLCNSYHKMLLNAFLSKNKNKAIYTFDYSDDSTWGSMMEHDGIFENLNYIRISQH